MTAGKSTPLSSARTPKDADRPMRWRTRAASMRAFEGTHPFQVHSPPRRDAADDGEVETAGGHEGL
jgi:hypothetical protein